MTRSLNQQWSDHTGTTGVTCWTCHRGQNIPSETWTIPTKAAGQTIVGNRHGQNDPVSNSAYASLPNAAVARFLLGGEAPEEIRVVSKTAHPTPANQLSVMGGRKLLRADDAHFAGAGGQLYLLP